MQRADGLEFEVHGDGEPVLLIHGSHVADSFLPFAREPALAERYRLIRYHRRGLAGSAPHAGPFGIEQQARDALLPPRELGIERCHVVGHSYGAVTAVQLALDAPQAVHSLVLLEPPLQAPEDRATMAQIFGPLVQRYRSGDVRGAVEAFMDMACGSDWRREVAERVPGGVEQAEKDAATFFEVEVPALQDWVFDREKASRISQPALYVLGAESGPFMERPKELFCSLVPQAESVVLPGLNHLLQMRDPARVARTVADFLARHPL